MTNDETKLYFKVLQSLSKDSFINTKDITHFLVQYIETPKFKDQEELIQYNNNLLSFAQRFRHANHIVFNQTNIGEPQNAKGEICSNLRIYASLTPDGFIFLNNYLDRKANKRFTNFQIIATVLTTLFIGLTALYAYLTYKHDIKKDYELQQTTKQQQLPKSNKTPAKQTPPAKPAG
jgi:hypothetical protein